MYTYVYIYTHICIYSNMSLTCGISPLNGNYHLGFSISFKAGFFSKQTMDTNDSGKWSFYSTCNTMPPKQLLVGGFNSSKKY